MLLSIPVAAQSYRCLPGEVRADQVVKTTPGSDSSGDSIVTKTTVAQTLKRLRARCVGGKLVDRRGRGIRFYFLTGCWGNPPADYLEMMDRQRTELALLKKRFTVIEMTCDPSGDRPPQSRPLVI